MSGTEPSSGGTTERLDPNHALVTRQAALIYAMHLATYNFAAEYTKGRRVLDFGCGIGYGTARIASSAAEVTGVDVSPEAIDAATSCFGSSGARFRQIQPVEQERLPFHDDSFDVVLSFQVYEHLGRPDVYLHEVARVLAPGGTFLCVTPDRTHRLYPKQRPWNRFHLREYDESGMLVALRPYFDSVEVAGMSAPPDLADLEFHRYRRLKKLTYPVTFPGVPEVIRTHALAWLQRLESRRSSGENADGRSLEFWGIDVADIAVFTEERPSLNVVCVAGTRRDERAEPRPDS